MSSVDIMTITSMILAGLAGVSWYFAYLDEHLSPRKFKVLQGFSFHSEAVYYYVRVSRFGWTWQRCICDAGFSTTQTSLFTSVADACDAIVVKCKALEEMSKRKRDVQITVLTYSEISKPSGVTALSTKLDKLKKENKDGN